MKRISLFEANSFNDNSFSVLMAHESEHLKVLNFNLKVGQELPLHSHDLEGQLVIVVVEGDGEFLAEGGKTLPAKHGDVLVSDIREPHGIRATTRDMRVLVTIAPPI